MTINIQSTLLSLPPRAKRGGQQSAFTTLELRTVRTAAASGRLLLTGFTLVELLVVISVIAVLAGILLPAAMQAWGRAYAEKARSQLASLEVALEMYKTDMGYYPADDGGTPPPTCKSMVTALTDTTQGGNWHGPYMSFKQGDLDADPPNGNFKDPWGNLWRYNNVNNNGPATPEESNANNKPGKFDLSSLGANGTDGGTGNDADIKNW